LSIPNYQEKIGKKPILTSEKIFEFKKIPKDFLPPEIILFCFNDELFKLIVKKYKTISIKGFFGELKVFKKFNNRIGIIGKFGIGGPVTAVLLEDLSHWGVKNIISLGFGSSIQSDIAIGQILVIEKAIRDEGTSQHYERSGKYAYASKELLKTISDYFNSKKIQYKKGTIWTTDAIYRETKEEVRQYQNEGVLGVDMESATLFTVAKYTKVQAVSIICVSDSLATLEWKFLNNSKELNRHFLSFLLILMDSLSQEFN
jgi:uridine phosphorylase